MRDLGWVRGVMRGREREYALDLGALAPLEGFLYELHQPDVWARRFEALATEVHRVRRQRVTVPAPAARPALGKKELA